MPLEIVCTQVVTNTLHPPRGRWVALLSIGIIFVYRNATFNPPLSRIPTLSMTHLFMIWLICVRTCVCVCVQSVSIRLNALHFPLGGEKTTGNTPHSSAVFLCIPMGPNRWHLLIENRWSRLYADWSAAPSAPISRTRCNGRCMLCSHLRFLACVCLDVQTFRVYKVDGASALWRTSGLNVISQRRNV